MRITAFALACALTLHAQVKDYGRDFRGVVDAHNSTRTRTFRVDSGTPSGSCTTNEWAWSTTASDLYYCPSGTWTAFPRVTPTGAQTLTNKTLTTPIVSAYTVSGLPAAGIANRLAIVTDAATAGSCTSGSGSNRSLCRDTGSAWESIGGGGGGTTYTMGNGIIIAGSVISADTTYVTDYGSLQAGQALSCRPAGGSGSAYSCNTSPIWATAPWVNGSRLFFRPDVNCAATPTLAINSGSAITLRRADGTAISSGDCSAGVPYTLEYNGTYWLMLNVPAASGGGSGTVTSVTAAAPLSVTNGTTTPALTFDSLFNVETSGFDPFCGKNSDTYGPGTLYGRFSINRDDINTTGGSGYTIQDVSTPCTVELTSGSTSGNTVGISQNSNNAFGLFFAVGTAGWRWDGFLTLSSGNNIAGSAPNSSPTANVYVLAGLTHSQGSNPSLCASGNCAAILLDTAASNNFQLRVCNGGSCANTDTGVTAAADTLYRFSLSSTTNGTVAATINGSTAVTASLPTANLGPGFYVKTLTSGIKRVRVHGHAWKGARRWQ